MMSTNDFDSFRHFLDCHFNQSYDTDEVLIAAQEFVRLEPSLIGGLLLELKELQQRGDWAFVQQFVKQHGTRRLSHERLQTITQTLIEFLSQESV